MWLKHSTGSFSLVELMPIRTGGSLSLKKIGIEGLKEKTVKEWDDDHQILFQL